MSAAVRLGLLGTFTLVRGKRRVELPLSCQRLVGFLALRDTPLMRPRAAGTLWPDVPEEHAMASLRSALWRIHQRGCEVVAADDLRLSLAPDVELDVRAVASLAHRVVNDTWPLPANTSAVVEELSADLLPDWYEDWVAVERDQLALLRLDALEALAARLLEADRIEEAGEAAVASVAADPLRESAHRALIRVHLAKGNVAVALRQYGAFRQLSRERLGVRPSSQMEQLVRAVTRR
jgi:DNA-binding SARP family transcriptional activator